MDIRKDILDKYKEFNEFLETINLNKLEETYSRQELTEFKSDLQKINLRSLSYEIGELTKKLKEKEFPQLLGVHHFPIINNIDFLTEEQKIELDNYLLKHRVGNFVYSFWRIVSNEKTRIRLENWLETQGIIEKHYAVSCPNCYEGYLSKFISLSEKEQLNKMFYQYQNSYDEESYNYLEKILDNCCMECDHYTEFEDIKLLNFKEEYKMMAERDKSLDHI